MEAAQEQPSLQERAQATLVDMGGATQLRRRHFALAQKLCQLQVRGGATQAGQVLAVATPQARVAPVGGSAKQRQFCRGQAHRPDQALDLMHLDPVEGPVAPQEFITIAEDCGLIVPLGQWVLEQACDKARRWQETIAPDC